MPSSQSYSGPRTSLSALPARALVAPTGPKVYRKVYCPACGMPPGAYCSAARDGFIRRRRAHDERVAYAKRVGVRK